MAERTFPLVSLELHDLAPACPSDQRNCRSFAATRGVHTLMIRHVGKTAIRGASVSSDTSGSMAQGHILCPKAQFVRGGAASSTAFMTT